MGHEEGIHYYDLMGLDLPSVKDYKKKFGGETVEIKHATKKDYSLKRIIGNFI